ncbi:YbhB/YbcL family Raf kinase inhibitor-like protein [Rhodosalinus sediminis]|uniref:YbhB/YbcL family Raf kinase inhibitor-like protein n=1 Tax=Rhodosalinus sediminis TaxID=1940533 RepID=UPI003B591A88
MLRPFITSASALFILAGCQGIQDAENVSRLGVEFSWEDTSRCSSESPAFTITDVPPQADQLRFEMKDLDVPSFNHGGGTVEYSGGNQVPAGAFSYTGPCPPAGSHDYEFTVEAIDTDTSMVIARGKAVRAFPPK